MSQKYQPYLSVLILLSAFVVAGCKDKSGESGGTGTSSGNDGLDPKVVQVSAEDRLKAEVLKNRGIGHLENQELADAEENLAELAKLLPNDRLAVRNLAILRLMSAIEAVSKRKPGDEGESAFRRVVADASSAIEAYQKFEGDTYDKALADLLMGKLLVVIDSREQPTFEQGIETLRKAADQVPNEADFRYALAKEMDGHRSYSDPRSEKPGQLIEELKQCVKLAPDNIAAAIRLAQRQALNLNSNNEFTREKALQLDETLSQLAALVVPFNASIKKRHSIDLLDLMDKAVQDAKSGNVAKMMGPAMQTFNLLSPEIATQIDLRRIDRDLLEYVLFDFAESVGSPVASAGTACVVTEFSVPADSPVLLGVSRIQMLDFDLDSHDDAVVIQNGRFQVYARDAQVEGGWKPIASAPESVGEVSGFLLFDIDRDFDKAITELQSPRLLLDKDGDRKIVSDPAQQERWFDTDYDVVLWGANGVTVWRNVLQSDGSRVLELVPQEATVDAVNDVIAADLDADGDLDLVFATSSGLRLWTNLDGTTFEVGDSAYMPEGEFGSLAACDWDQNIAMDVVAVASKDGKCGLLQNILHNRFRWQTGDSAIQEIPAGSRIAIGEFDGRGSWDVVAAGDKGVVVLLTEKQGEAVTVAKQVQLLDQPVRAAKIADLDNDGLSDILAWSASGLHLFRSAGGGQFEDLSGLLPKSGAILDVAINDVDDDGDLDLVCVAADGGRMEFQINKGGNQNHWVTVVARGKPDDSQFKSRRVNSHATGAVIEVRCGDQYQSHLISEPKIHIGLGQCERPDSIRIVWTDGIPQHITVPDLLRPRIGILAPQILKGSCPYIYTWTGDRFEFFSDCLWAAPLGLVQANGELAPTREWENLLVPGEMLVEKDGRYELQLTEELWEVAYFDQVQLTAIDHPADVDIFTNEKVGPPSMAEHRVHTVKTPRLPKSVVDGRGNNLLPGLTAQDGDYIQAFEGRVMQGLTDEWVMEFDLGDIVPSAADDASPNIRLFLLGWIFPTDTSLNLNIEQDSSIAPPAPPSIEVPDGRGGWKVVRPFIGFPSGKTKAMVVDISDVFTGDGYRFRLKSSMELYWDQAFFTVDETDAETVAQSCELVSSDLHYRGFSRRVYGDNALFRNGRAPEGYDYQSVTTDPRWPPIAGRFTRYGDATSLLMDHDDQMVVMGPGDELTISFAVPSKPVPDGWKRDFVLRNVGYDKDADLNTIYGQSSEPFPFQSMSRYPFAGDEQTPDSPEYKQYIQEWQTREYSRKPFWNAMRP